MTGSFLRNPYVHRIVPKSSTGCARRHPHPGPFASAPHVLCSECAREDDATRCERRGAEPPTDIRGRAPGQFLERAIRAGYIDAGRFNIPEANIQPASLDLRLGERALRIRCSFLPGPIRSNGSSRTTSSTRSTCTATGRCSRRAART